MITSTHLPVGGDNLFQHHFSLAKILKDPFVCIRPPYPLPYLVGWEPVEDTAVRDIALPEDEVGHGGGGAK